MAYRRVYYKDVVKWGAVTGVAGAAIFLLFSFLVAKGDIEITGYSNTDKCIGDELSPCIAIINFTAKKDIYIYPNESWTVFGTDQPLKEVKFQRSWGKGWRTIDLNSTWNKNVKYSIKFSANQAYTVRILGYKNSEFQNIKWSFGSLDPWWNTTWTQSMNFTVTERNGTSFTAMQVYMNISRSQLNHNVSSGFQDFRLVDDSNNVMPCWNETQAGSAGKEYMELWFKAPSLTASANKTYSIYYNVSGESGYCDDILGTAYEVGDDFTSSTLNTTMWYSRTLSDGNVSMRANGYVWLNASANPSSAEISSKIQFTNDVTLRWKSNQTNYVGADLGLGFNNKTGTGGGIGAGSYGEMIITGTTGNYNVRFISFKRTDGVEQTIVGENSIGANVFSNMTKFQIFWGNASKVEFWTNNSQTNSITTNIPTTPVNISFYEYQNNGLYREIMIDWVFARKYALQQPFAELTGIGVTEGVVDITKPLWSTNATNSTLANAFINHSVVLTDETGLDYYIFEFNNGTGGSNGTNITTFDISGTTVTANQTVKVNSTVGVTIRWRYYFNDTSNNWNKTDLFGYVTSEEVVGVVANVFFNGSANNTYETGEGMNLTGSQPGSNCLYSNNSYIGNGINCGTGRIEINITANNGINTLNDSKTKTKNLTYTGAGNQTVWIRLNRNDTAIVNNTKINLTGYLNSGTYPTSVRIYINDTQSNFILGQLIEGTQNVTTLNDSSISKNITFSQAASITSYVQLQKNVNITDAKLNLSSYEHYSTGLEQTNFYSLQLFPDAEFMIAQSFNFSNNENITNVSVYLDDNNNDANGYISLQLRLGSTSQPNSTIVATGNLTKDEVIDVTKWYNFTINYQIQGGVTYWIVLTSNTTGGGTYYRTGYYNFESYKNGTLNKSSDSGATWVGDRWAYDITFRIYTLSNASNPYLDVGGDGDHEWNYTGEFNHSNNRTGNFSAELNNYLSGCNEDVNGNCNVPLVLHSDSAGIINISAINVTFSSSFNPIVLNANLINQYLRNSTSGIIEIPINFSTTAAGIINISAINITFYGSGTYNVTIRNTTNQIEGNFTVVYSNFSRKLPYTFTNDILFNTPSTNDSRNVSAYGQSSQTPFYNVTWTNYDKNADMAVRLVEDLGCINITISNTSSLDNRFNITKSYATIYSNRQVNSTNTTNIWMWTDYYNCNRTQLAFIIPNITFRSCAINALRCW